MIQATTPQESSVFQSEAKALLLAAKFAQLLQVEAPIFITDNQVLAKTAAARKLDHPLLHWNARAYLADYFEATSSLLPQVFHVSRELNIVAHNCAAQVLRRSLNQHIYKCLNSAHSLDSCPIVSTIQNVDFQDFVITAAWCR